MDILAIREKAGDWIKQYKFVVLVLLAGLLLMLLPNAPEEKAAPAEVRQEQQETLQDQLGDLLSHMQGAGKVRVLLTVGSGAETVYQTDKSVRSDGQQSDIRGVFRIRENRPGFHGIPCIKFWPD